jgi:hypothetical protein
MVTVTEERRSTRMSEVETCYADIKELQHAGFTGLASLVRAAGLPLEIIGMVNHHVALITQLDYEEGRPKPLVKRERVWSDVLMEALTHQAGRGRPVCQSLAIHPDSTCERVPRWWGQEA